MHKEKTINTKSKLELKDMGKLVSFLEAVEGGETEEGGETDQRGKTDVKGSMTVAKMIVWLKTQKQDAIVQVLKSEDGYVSPENFTGNKDQFDSFKGPKTGKTFLQLGNW